MTEKPVYERRSVLRMMLGIGAVTLAGSAMMLPGEVQAAPVAPSLPPMPEPETARDMAPDSEKPEALETQYYYRRRVYARPRRRVVVVRRRPVYRRRRVVIVRRRPVYRRRFIRYY